MDSETIWKYSHQDLDDPITYQGKKIGRGKRMTPEFLTWESIWMVVRRKERGEREKRILCVCM